MAKAGSGSDYFRGLTRATWHDWRDIVLDPVLRTVDAARFESPACNGPLYFLNMATFGMSAEVVRQKALLSPLWPKSLRYLLPTVRGLFTGRESRVRLNLDGQILESRGLLHHGRQGGVFGGRHAVRQPRRPRRWPL